MLRLAAFTGEGCHSYSSKYSWAHSVTTAKQKNKSPTSNLRRAHYKEYLVSLINAHSLDPATLYKVEELETAVERYLHVHPQPLAGEDAAAYHARLLQVKLPPQPHL